MFFCFSWFSISMMPKFLIFLPFFSFAVTLWFHVFFSSIFIFVVQVFFLLFLSQLLTVKNLLIVLGTWGDFLRWFRYLDFFFFIPKRDNHDVFVLFSYDFESAEEKKKDWIDFFLVRRAEIVFWVIFFEKSLVEMTLWFFIVWFLLFRYRFTEFVRFWFDFYITTDFFSFPSTILVMKL